MLERDSLFWVHLSLILVHLSLNSLCVWFLVSCRHQENKNSLDLILNTIPSYHDYGMYKKLLTPKGKQVLLGLHKGHCH